MYLTGNFVAISVESRTKDGKTYYSANIEADDGKLFRIYTTPEVAVNIQKYQLHRGLFDVGTYKDDFYMRLVDVELISREPAADPAPDPVPEPKAVK